jgi:hypothetical protein
MVVFADFSHVVDGAETDMSEGIGESWAQVNVNSP